MHALRVRIFMMRRASKRALRTQVAAGADQCPTQPHPAGCPGPRRPRGESPPVPPARVACARAAPCGSSIRACGGAGSTPGARAALPGARAANADPARGDDHCRRFRDCGLAFFFESTFIKSNPKRHPTRFIRRCRADPKPPKSSYHGSIEGQFHPYSHYASIYRDHGAIVICRCDVTGTRDWPLPGPIQELAPDP
jgi:hypothetical protein